MKRHLTHFFRHPWYPLAFAAYPPLALLLNNISEMRISGGLRSIAVCILLSAALTGLLRLLYRSWRRAAFASWAMFLLIFTYGHVRDSLGEQFEDLTLDPWFWILWILLAAASLLWAARPKTHFEKAALVFNVTVLGLALFTLAQVLWFSLPRQEQDTPADEFAPIQPLSIPAGETPPDIYYIILDSYARSDLLAQKFDYDNSQFLENLRQMGFYVADCAQSNYNRTDISLASSLNLDYLQNLSADYRPPSQSRRTLWASINNSAVRYMLEEAGYTSVAFATGFAWSEVDHSDIFLAPPSFWQSITSFEVLLMRTTPARHLEETGLLNLAELDGRHYRERTQFILDKMDDLAHMPGPKFVFIHIIPPHPPFVYAPDGSFTDPGLFLNEDQRYTSESYTLGYRNQVEYITGQIEQAIRTLLAESSQPPIIILQGDHGPWLQSGNRKFFILNAYHLPGHNDLLYPTISPVNTFRLIFNAYFGAHYDLLPDTSYYSPIPNIYEFEEAPNPCAEK